MSHALTSRLKCGVFSSFSRSAFAADVIILHVHERKICSPSSVKPSILAYPAGVVCSSSVSPRNAQASILRSRAWV